MDKTFAEKLKQVKKDAGLIQQDVADILKISKRAVEEWERGKSQPPEYVQPFILTELENLAKGKTNEPPLKKLVKIAEENIPELEGRGDLEAKQSDSLDFFETSVWGLKAALIAAYELGKKEGAR